MTELDDVLVPAVAALLADLGKTVTVEQVTKVYDEDTGTTTTTVVGTHTVKVSPPAPYAAHLVDGDLIRNDDAQVLLAKQGLACEPVIGWKVTIDGVVWKILDVDKVYSGELVCAHQLQLRR